MKNTIYLTTLLFVFSIFSGPAWAGSCRLVYKLIPGQVWKGTLSSQNEYGISSKKKKSHSKTIVEYRVKKGPKKGWAILEARILSTGKKAVRQRMDFSRITYAADIHETGEIRNITFSGEFMPDLGKDAENIPPQTLEMMKQSLKMVPEMYKHMVYWFPEVPEEKLEIGDEFDVKMKMGLNTPGTPMQMKAMVKQVYTLEDVSDGLAFFSVRERSVAKGNAAGMDTKTRKAGKGEAIFDLNRGMWLEVTEKAKVKVGMSSGSSAGQGDYDMTSVRKYEMEPL